MNNLLYIVVGVIRKNKKKDLKYQNNKKGITYNY